MEEKGKNAVKVLEEVASRMEKEEELRKKIKWVNWGFPVVVIIVFLIFLSNMYSAVKNIKSEHFIAKLEQNSLRVWPKLTGELKRVGEAVFPIYAKELDAMLTKPIPDMDKKIENETASLQKVLDDKIKVNINTAFKKIHEQQKKMLAAKFPTLAKDPKKLDAMLAMTQNASKAWTKGKLTKVMEENLYALKQMQETLDKGFRLKKGDKAKGRLDGEQVLSLWLDVLNESLHDKDTIIEPDKKAK